MTNTITPKIPLPQEYSNLVFPLQFSTLPPETLTHIDNESVQTLKAILKKQEESIYEVEKRQREKLAKMTKPSKKDQKEVQVPPFTYSNSLNYFLEESSDEPAD